MTPNAESELERALLLKYLQGLSSLERTFVPRRFGPDLRGNNFFEMRNWESGFNFPNRMLASLARDATASKT